MDSWERFDETMLPNKKEFYSNLNLEDITEKAYAHAQNVWDTFNIKNLGEYTFKHTHYYYFQTYLKTSEKYAQKYINLIQHIFCLHQD